MTLRSLTCAVAAALAVGGCTGEAPSPQVASAARPTVSTGPGAGEGSPSAGPESDYDKALRFTRCMNALGERIPDPVEGKPLQLMTMNEQDEWIIGTPSPNFAKCKQYLPTTWLVKEDPKELAKEAKFVDCLIKHGIPIPQPDAQGMVRVPVPTELFGPEDPEREAAMNACRYLYDDPANNSQ